MVIKIKKEDCTPVCGQKTLKFLARMTKSKKSSSYKRMESDDKEKKKSKKLDQKKAEEFSKGKENVNNKPLAKEVKEKKKKKGWKRVRQAALTTCRYIGMGAAHMSPATMYSSPEYYVDPKYWNRSFNSTYKHKVPPPTPAHWATTTLMFSNW